MNWTVSTTPAGIWGVYLNGRLVLAGYASSRDAEWALGHIQANQVPPYLPSSAAADLRRRLDYIAAHGSAPVNTDGAS